MAEKTKFWYLKHFNMFEGMDEQAMHSLDRISSMITTKTHQPIYFPDEPSSAIFFLKEGHVKISRINSEGNEVILDIVGPGEIFGELSEFEEQEPGSEMAAALDEAVICTVKKEDFDNLVKMNPSLNFEITKRIGLRLRRFEERISDLVFKDVRKRIASFLVRFAEEMGKIKGGIITIRTHLSHQEIAFLTGAARQTVTTTLNEFRSAGLIDFSRGEISIKDFVKLQSLAK